MIKLTIPITALHSCLGSYVTLEMKNPSFEVDEGWEGLDTSTQRTAAPPFGNSFALISKGGSRKLSQDVDSFKVKPGDKYKLSVWMRSANPRGPERKTVAQVSLNAGQVTNISFKKQQAFFFRSCAFHRLNLEPK